MYLRNANRRTRDGSVVAYYQLAESFCHKGNKTSQTPVIYSFGCADQLDPEILRCLVESIQRMLSPYDAACPGTFPSAGADLQFNRAVAALAKKFFFNCSADLTAKIAA